MCVAFAMCCPPCQWCRLIKVSGSIFKRSLRPKISQPAPNMGRQGGEKGEVCAPVNQGHGGLRFRRG